MNKPRDTTISSFRPKISLNFAQMIRNPTRLSVSSPICYMGAMLPVYVSMYEVTIQLLRLKPCRSSVMATSDVATIETSRLARKTARDKLSMH